MDEDQVLKSRLRQRSLLYKLRRSMGAASYEYFVVVINFEEHSVKYFLSRFSQEWVRERVGTNSEET